MRLQEMFAKEYSSARMLKVPITYRKTILTYDIIHTFYASLDKFFPLLF